MHYPWNAFSSNGKDTITPLRNYDNKVPYIALSKLDAKQTSLMYNCKGTYRRNNYKSLLFTGSFFMTNFLR